MGLPTASKPVSLPPPLPLLGCRLREGSSSEVSARRSHRRRRLPQRKRRQAGSSLEVSARRWPHRRRRLLLRRRPQVDLTSGALIRNRPCPKKQLVKDPKKIVRGFS